MATNLCSLFELLAYNNFVHGSIISEIKTWKRSRGSRLIVKFADPSSILGRSTILCREWIFSIVLNLTIIDRIVYYSQKGKHMGNWEIMINNVNVISTILVIAITYMEAQLYSVELVKSVILLPSYYKKIFKK